MPYKSPEELPEQFDRYAPEQKQAALDAFNGCMYDGPGEEGQCFEAAHVAAKNAQPERDTQGDRPSY